MSESTSIASSAKLASDAAALSLIDIRRIDRAAGKGAKTKRGDLTHKLKRQSSGEAPVERATVAPAAAPIAAPLPVPAPPIAPAPELPSLAAYTPESAPTPVAALPIAPALKSPPLAAFTTEPASAPAVLPLAPAEESPPLAASTPEPAPARRAVALPEPYFAPEPPPEPEAPALPAAGSEAPRSAPLPYDDLRSVDDLIYYWDELRAGRELPLFSKLDRTRIAISWPDTVMVNYEADRAALPQIARLSRLTGVVEFTSMVTEWILSCSRQVARIGKAMETKRDFDGAESPRSYHMLLLPFATPHGASDHVLCHLSCAD